MMKNENGITLATLVVTIIVLLILASVSLNMTFTEIDNVKNDKLKAELGIVRQAVEEQYQKAEALGKTGVSKTDAQLDIWVGTKLETLESGTFPDSLDAILTKDGIEKANLFTYDYSACEKQEDCYYKLTPQNLQQLGIEKSEHNYIVNYKTGEVYNETQKVTFDNELLYLTPINYGSANAIDDEATFNDWSDDLDDEDNNDMIEVRQYDKNN